ncbi:MAG: hypothetical protein ACK5WZ_09375 [Pseudobdellovibrionaceae bacterium]
MSDKLKRFQHYIIFSGSIVTLLGLGLIQPLIVEKIHSSVYDRKPASLPAAGKNLPPKSLPVLEKLQPMVQVKINHQLEIPETGDDEVLLEAWVKVNTDIQDEVVHFEWKLDPGIQVIEGDVSSELSNMIAGEYRYLSLRVYGFSKESQKLAIPTASLELRGDQFGHSSQYNSRQEDSFEFLAPMVQEEAEKLNIANARKGRLQR